MIAVKSNAIDQKRSLKKMTPQWGSTFLFSSKNGTNPFIKAPSPKSLLRRLERRKAIKKVETAGDAPKQKAIDKSRAIPVIRLIKVPVKKYKAPFAIDLFVSAISITG